MPLSSVDIPHSTPWKTVFGLAQLTDDPHTWMLTGGLIRPVVIADMYHRRLFIFMHPCTPARCDQAITPQPDTALQ